MVMRLPSRFMATRSGTVTFFGAGVDVPPYWSLMSNLRPGRLRAGPGVNAIVPLACISQDSFQIADRPYEEQARRDHDSHAAPDDEGLSRAERCDDRRENDWCQGEQEGSAEEVDARHTPKEFPRYVLLYRRRPEHPDPDELNAESHREQDRRRHDGYEAHPDERGATQDREETDRYPEAPDVDLREHDASDDVANPDGSCDRGVHLCIATEYIAHEDRHCHRERTEEAQDDDRPRKDKDPKPLYREGVSETFAHLPQDGHGGRRLATRRPREPYGPKPREEPCRVRAERGRASPA